MTLKNQKGSIVTYALIAIFLTGVLVAAMSTGAKKSASTGHLDEMVLFLNNDLKTIQEAVSECVQTYPGAIDVNADGVVNATDNPNPPFALYNNLSSGAAGDTATAIKCPGAPTAQQVIFSGNSGDRFKLLGDTATYTTRYFNDATEGVYIRVTRAAPEALWTEAIARVNTKYSQCSVANVTAAGTCVNGCLYFWMVRPATSVLGPEPGCP